MASLRAASLATVALLASCATAETPVPVQAPEPQPARYLDQQSYMQAVQKKIRANLMLPRRVPQTATTTFEVALTEAGEVASMKRVKKSSSPAYEKAVETAILKSQPLPLLGAPGTKQPTLLLVFRVKE
jgi:colicin import membrane protein